MINNKLVFAITLARGGSKTIKNKNLSVIGGKSLIQRSIECAVNSKYIDRYFVSSDSSTILDESKKFGAEVIIRPSEFASDVASSASAISHFINNLDRKPDYIVELMCTCPFKKTEDVDKCIEKLDSTQSDSVVTVCRILDHHPSRVKYIENDQLMNFFPEKKESRRQDLEPHAYVRSGGVYVFTLDSMLKYNSRYGGIVRPVIVDNISGINIDEENDLFLAQLIGDKYER